MLLLQDIMTRDVVTLSPEHTLREAMSLFASKHISGAPVVANQKVIGVVSLTDLVELASSAPGVPTERPVSAEWGEWDEPLEMPEDDESPAEYFQDLWDDGGAEVSDRIADSGGPEWDALQAHTVGEAMSRNVKSMLPTTPVDFAADFMRKASIHRVLVMQGGRLLGVVSTRDIADAVADHRLTAKTYVFGAPRYM